MNRAITDTVSGPNTTPLTTTRYDHDGNVFQVQQPNGPESWAYDSNGNLLSNTEYNDGQTRTTVYTYSATTPNQEVQQHTDGLGWDAPKI